MSGENDGPLDDAHQDIIDGIVEEMQRGLAELMYVEPSYPYRTWLHSDPYCKCVLEWLSRETVTVHVAPECRLHGEGTEVLAYLRSVEAAPETQPDIESRYDALTNWQDATVDLRQTIDESPLRARQLPSGDNPLHG